MTVSGYTSNEWQPTRWHVYLCDITGAIQEELLDVEFASSDQLNQIPTCSVSVTGKKFGYFRPWLHTIAVTGNSLEEVFFFGPIISSRAQVADAAEYAVTTELECQGWEAWLDRVYPMVEFFSEPGGSDAKSACDAVTAIWASVTKRANKFQVRPGGAIQAPADTINVPELVVTLDWDTVSEETRPGAPSAWSMHTELHAQGIDVNYRPTWDAAGNRFYSRCVIGGSTNATTAQMKNYKTGRWLTEEYVVGGNVSGLTVEMRGDMQATSVLATGVDSAYGVAPTYGNTTYSVENASDTAVGVFPDKAFAGLLLEYQYPADVQTTNSNDPDAACATIAKAQRERLRRTPTLVAEMQIQWSPGQIRPGDIMGITDNGGAQFIDPTDSDEFPDGTVSTRWSLAGRVSGVQVSSADMLHAEISMFELNDPNLSVTPGLMRAAGTMETTALATESLSVSELSQPSKASLSVVSFEQSLDNTVVDVERLLLQRGTGGGTVSGVPAGSIVAYGGETIPDGWLVCYGQIIDRVQYGPLFTALGTKYGAGNGETTFGIPDLRSRFIWGAGNTPLAEQGGDYYIGADKLPAHSHGMLHSHTAGTPQSVEHKHDVAATTWARRYAVYPGSVEAPGGAAAPTNASWGSGLAPAATSNERYANGTHPAGAHDHGTLTTSNSRASTDNNSPNGAVFMPRYYAMYYIIKAT